MNRGLILSFAALFLAGCVGMDFGSDPGGGRSRAGAGLNAEQRWNLQSAAKGGEHELVSTVARMVWDARDSRQAVAEYATELRPESAEQIGHAAGL